MKKDQKINYEKQLARLDKYTLNEDLQSFNLLHIYPTKKQAFPNGYYDSMFFDLHLFNTSLKEKTVIKNRDGLDFFDCFNNDMDMVRVFVDGSFLMRFKTMKHFEKYQCVSIK